MASYYFTKRASKDLALIWNYTVDTWSENQADHYYRMLISCCQDISDGRVYGKQYDGIHPGLLGKKAGKHIIFYRIINQDVVEIVRILHERMDLGKHL
jgi:toxin ParE1/3/4